MERIEYIEERVCKKCGKTKLTPEFCNMVNGGKSYDCKECRSKYNKAYALLNRETIRDNERLRKNRAKTNKTYKDNLTTIEYHRNPTKAEIKFGEGAIHYKSFTLDQCIKKDGNTRVWLICPIDGLRYYY